MFCGLLTCKKLHAERGNMQNSTNLKYVGENHPRAQLSDHEVDLMRRLHEDQLVPMGYKKLAEKFDVPIRTVRDICNYRTRRVNRVR